MQSGTGPSGYQVVQVNQSFCPYHRHWHHHLHSHNILISINLAKAKGEAPLKNRHALKVETAINQKLVTCQRKTSKEHVTLMVDT